MSQINTKLTGSAPIFIVKDIIKSGEYYKNILGFDFKDYWGNPPTFCMPERDRLSVFLQQAGDPAKIQPNGKINHDMWDAYFWLNDAEALFNEYKDKGVEILYEPTIQKLYQMKEFAIKDLDGYILAFGQDWTEQLK